MVTGIQSGVTPSPTPSQANPPQQAASAAAAASAQAVSVAEDSSGLQLSASIRSDLADLQSVVRGISDTVSALESSDSALSDIGTLLAAQRDLVNQGQGLGRGNAFGQQYDNLNRAINQRYQLLTRDLFVITAGPSSDGSVSASSSLADILALTTEALELTTSILSRITGASAGSGAADPDPAAGAGSGAADPDPAAGAGSGAAAPDPAAGAGSGAADPDPAAGAGSGAADPDPAAGAGSGAADPDPAAGAGSGAADPDPAAGAGSGAADPDPAAGAGSGAADPDPAAGAGSGTADPDPAAGAGSGVADPDPAAGAGSGADAARATFWSQIAETWNSWSDETLEWGTAPFDTSEAESLDLDEDQVDALALTGLTLLLEHQDPLGDDETAYATQALTSLGLDAGALSSLSDYQINRLAATGHFLSLDIKSTALPPASVNGFKALVQLGLATLGGLKIADINPVMGDSGVWSDNLNNLAPMDSQIASLAASGSATLQSLGINRLASQDSPDDAASDGSGAADPDPAAGAGPDFVIDPAIQGLVPSDIQQIFSSEFTLADDADEATLVAIGALNDLVAQRNHLQGGGDVQSSPVSDPTISQIETIEKVDAVLDVVKNALHHIEFSHRQDYAPSYAQAQLAALGYEVDIDSADSHMLPPILDYLRYADSTESDLDSTFSYYLPLFEELAEHRQHLRDGGDAQSSPVQNAEIRQIDTEAKADTIFDITLQILEKIGSDRRNYGGDDVTLASGTLDSLGLSDHQINELATTAILRLGKVTPDILGISGQDRDNLATLGLALLNGQTSSDIRFYGPSSPFDSLNALNNQIDTIADDLGVGRAESLGLSESQLDLLASLGMNQFYRISPQAFSPPSGDYPNVPLLGELTEFMDLSEELKDNLATLGLAMLGDGTPVVDLGLADKEFGKRGLGEAIDSLASQDSLITSLAGQGGTNLQNIGLINPPAGAGSGAASSDDAADDGSGAADPIPPAGAGSGAASSDDAADDGSGAADPIPPAGAGSGAASPDDAAASDGSGVADPAPPAGAGSGAASLSLDALNLNNDQRNNLGILAVLSLSGMDSPFFFAGHHIYAQIGANALGVSNPQSLPASLSGENLDALAMIGFADQEGMSIASMSFSDEQRGRLAELGLAVLGGLRLHDVGLPMHPLPDAGFPMHPLPDAGFPMHPLPDAGLPMHPLPDAGFPMHPLPDEAAVINVLNSLTPPQQDRINSQIPLGVMALEAMGLVSLPIADGAAGAGPDAASPDDSVGVQPNLVNPNAFAGAQPNLVNPNAFAGAQPNLVNPKASVDAGSDINNFWVGY